jgi:hypothetical protein
MATTLFGESGAGVTGVDAGNGYTKCTGFSTRPSFGPYIQTCADDGLVTWSAFQASLSPAPAPTPAPTPAPSPAPATQEITLRNWLLDLTPEEGAAISGAVALVWVVGWALRQFIRMLSSSTDGNSSTSED